MTDARQVELRLERIRLQRGSLERLETSPVAIESGFGLLVRVQALGETDVFGLADAVFLAQHFSEKQWPRTGYRSDEAEAAAGETATVAGQCVQCQLGGYEGNSRVPRLSGQQLKDLEKTMLEFKHKVRLNSPAKGSLMSAYEDAAISAMAQFLAGM